NEEIKMKITLLQFKKKNVRQIGVPGRKTRTGNRYLSTGRVAEKFKINISSVPVWIFLLLSLVIFNSPPAQAQDRGNPNWYVRVAPYLWLSNIGGAKTLGQEAGANIMDGLQTNIEDTMLATNWAGRIEAGKGRWRALINFSRASDGNPTEILRLGDSTHIDGHYNLTWTSAEFFAAYQIGPFSENHAFELYGGGRYMKHQQKLSSENTASLTEINQSWVEGVFGFRFYTELGKRFWAQFHSDIGGFGAGSNFSWTLGGEAAFRMVKFADLTLRYDYQEVEFVNDKEGTNRFIWDNGVQQGWYFGVMFKL
ncbi:MAG: hypothetical protein ACE5GL_04125, partial [Calditrichia bacterium]